MRNSEKVVCLATTLAVSIGLVSWGYPEETHVETMSNVSNEEVEEMIWVIPPTTTMTFLNTEVTSTLYVSTTTSKVTTTTTSTMLTDTMTVSTTTSSETETTTTTEETTEEETTTTETTTKKMTTKKVTTTTTTTTEMDDNEEITETTTSSEDYYNIPITESERIMLTNLVAHEYGANWVSLKEKAKIVMVVMNRVNSNKFPNTIHKVILQKGQFCNMPDDHYIKKVTDSCIEAVYYYFNHIDEYATNLYFYYGNGRENIFREHY